MRHRSATVRILSFLAVVAVLTGALGTHSALAYNDYAQECHWNQSPYGSNVTVYYRWGPSINVSGAEANGFRVANSDWNGLPTKMRIYYSAGAGNTFDAYYAPDDVKQGRTWYTCNWFYTYLMDSFDAKRNTAHPLDATGNHEIAGHEIGHGLGLGHSYDTNAIMHDPVSVVVPGADDIAGLNSLYP